MVGSFVVRRPGVIVAAVILVTIFMSYGVTRLSSSTDFQEFLPSDSPAVRTSEEFKRNFGSATEIILVKAENVIEAQIFLAINRLENSLRTEASLQDYIVDVSSYVDYVNTYLPPGSEFLPDPALEEFIQATLSQPGVSSAIGRLLSDNQGATLITVSTASGLSADERNEKTKIFVDHVRSFDENDENVELGVTGDLILNNEIFDLMGRDNRVLIPAAGVFVVIVLFFVFRRFSDIGIPLVTVALGAVWALGAMAWLNLKFTMIHVAMIPLILGLGIDYSVHMLNRYYEERGKGAPAGKAIRASMRTTGIAMTLAALTTIVGFGSFMISDLPPLRTLGALSAAGVASTFVLSTTFLPALLVLRDRKGGKVKAMVARRGKRVDRLLSAAAIGAEHHNRTVVAVAVTLAIVGSVAIYGISTSMSFETFLPPDVPSIAALNEIEDQFGGQMTIYVLANGGIKTPEGLQAMLDLENAVLADSDNLITGSLSLADVVSSIAGGIPPSEAAVEPIIENDALPDLIKTQLGKVLDENLAVIYFYVNTTTDQEMAEASRIIRAHVENVPTGFIDMTLDGGLAVGGEPVVISEVLVSINEGMVRTTILALILCLLILILAFKSLQFGAMAMMPLLLTVGWEFGTLRALGWSMDVLTMGISALVIGIGIDYAVHIVHRFREERRGNDIEQAIRTTIMHVGTALIAAAATTIGVFGILALSRMPVFTRFGALTALVIFFAFAAALVVLPSILVVVRRRKRKK